MTNNWSTPITAAEASLRHVESEAYEYRTHCGSGHRRRRRPHCAYLASGSDESAPQAPVAQLPTVDVLVAKSDIGLGQTVKPDDLQWQTWPAATASNSFMRRDNKADAVKDVTGAIARAPFIAGEPIRDAKLVKADGTGFMAAILPTGMRAVSTEISPETGAGGFILPNDRVDVLLSKREKSSLPGAADVVESEVDPEQHPRARDRPGPEGKGRHRTRWSARP